MQVWNLNFEVDEYSTLKTRAQMSLEEIRSFNGSSKERKWKSREVVTMEPKLNLPKSDVTCLHTHMPVFNDKAINVLQPFLKDSVEILPLTYSEGKYYLINVTNVIDCIDYEHSEVKYFPDGKKVLRFITYSFIKEKIASSSIFRIPEQPYGNFFVSNEFKEAVIQNGLTGFKFSLAWEG